MSKLGKRRASATSQETGGTSGSEGIMELQRNSTQWRKVVEEIVKLEKKIFPKHESLARSFDEELKKRNSGLLYLEVDEQVVGYVMYSWPSSLFASITKLAGSATSLYSIIIVCIFESSCITSPLPIICLINVFCDQIHYL